MKPVVETPSQPKQVTEADAPPIRTEDPIEKLIRVGIRVSLWTLLVFVVFAMAFTSVFTVSSGLRSSEAMDNAQVAYNMVNGKGFSTNVIRPLGLVFSPNVENHPDGYNPPLYPWLLSIAFRLRGATDHTVVITSALFYFLLMPLVFLLAKKLFNPRVANWSLLFCVLNVSLLSYSVVGLAVPLAAFLVTLLAYLMASVKPPAANANNSNNSEPARANPALAGAAGLVLGLCALTQYSLGLLVIPVGIYLWRVGGKQRHLTLAALLAGFVIVVTPWLYRNHKVFGNPFFCLRNYEFIMGTAAYPGKGLYRSLTQDLMTPLQFLTGQRGAPVGMAKKYILSVNGFYAQAPALFNVLIMGFFLISLFYPFQNATVRRMRGALLLALVVLLFTVPFFDGSGGLEGVRALLPLIPMAMIFAAAAYVRLLDEWMKKPSARVATCVVTCLVMALPMLSTRLVQRRPPDNPSLSMLEALRIRAKSDEIIVTNTPWEVAWVSHRRAIYFPETAGTFPDIDEMIKPSRINFVYLSPATLSQPEAGRYWRSLYMNPTPFYVFEVDPSTNSNTEILFRRMDRQPPSSGS